MLWRKCACLGPHGCELQVVKTMLSKHERHYGLGMDALVITCSRNTNILMIGDGCSGDRMLSEHERHYGLGMDAPVIACPRNTNAIMVWGWMLW